MDPGLDPVAAAGTLRKAFSAGLNKYQLPVVGRDQGRQRRAGARRRRRADPRLLPRRRAAAAGRTRDHGLTSPTPYTPGRHEGLILAGGAGTRLRPITHTSAKQLVPVANTPILFYGIEAMVAAGITEIGVIVGDTRDEVMADARRRLAVRRLGSRTSRRTRRSAWRTACSSPRDFLGDDDFVMYLGDNLLEQDLERVRRRVRMPSARASDPPSAQILLKQVPDPHRFGIAELDADGNVVHLVEKPDDPPSTSRSSASTCSIATIHEAVAAIEPSARGELEITDAIQWLIDHGQRVRTELLTGWWIDTGKLTPLLEANRLLLETHRDRGSTATVDAESIIDGRVVIEAGAEIVNSTIRGPVAIGAGTTIIDSFIGPFTAIGAGCEVRHSEVEHSVVMERSQIIDIPRLEDSLIGSEAVVVAHRRRKPRAAALDGGRPLSDRRRVGDDPMPTVTRVDTDRRRVRRRADDPRRPAWSVHRDLPP